MSDAHTFKILMETLIQRLDNHGADIHDMKNRLDDKIELVIGKLDEIKEIDYKAHYSFSERLTKIEAEKGIVGKSLTILAGLIAGVGGSWLQKHL